MKIILYVTFKLVKQWVELIISVLIRQVLWQRTLCQSLECGLLRNNMIHLKPQHSQRVSQKFYVSLYVSTLMQLQISENKTQDWGLYKLETRQSALYWNLLINWVTATKAIEIKTTLSEFILSLQILNQCQQQRN